MHDMMNFAFLTQGPAPLNGRKVAVIGAGPSGLAVAGYLAGVGYAVEVFDKMPKPGGLMLFGIPEDVIPSHRIQQGVHDLERNYGVVFHTRTKVCSNARLYEEEGDHFTYDMVILSDLVEEYDAVMICTGSWRSRLLGIEGEDLPGVYSSLEFLFPIRAAHYASTNVNLPNVKGKKVAVVGAGHSAVDVVTSAHALGAAHITMIYRRSMREAPSGTYEIGKLISAFDVEWREKISPVQFLGDSELTGIKVQNMGSADSASSEAEEIIQADVCVTAIGEIPTPPFKKELGLDNVRKGDVHWLHMTNIENVFVAGDVLTGPSKIGKAVYSGLRAAKSLDHWLELKLQNRQDEYDYDADRVPLPGRQNRAD